MEEQPSSDVFLPLVDTQSSENKSDLIGCCSRFRACSDAQKCLMPNSDISECCAYRKNLDAGRIFYGKNASNFVLEEYGIILSKISKLPIEQLGAFKNIVGYLCSMHSSGILLYASPSILNPCLNELLSIRRASQYVLSQYRIRSITVILEKFPQKNSAYMKAERAQKDRTGSGSFDKRSFLIQWCTANAPEVIEQIVNRYVMVSIPSNIRRYIYEYYYENIPSEDFQFELEFPIETDANFLRNPSSSILGVMK